MTLAQLVQPKQQDVAPLFLRTGLASKPLSVRSALLQVERTLQRAGVPNRVQSSIGIALAEVLNNIVEHAYNGCGKNRISLSLWLSDTEVGIETRDNGKPLPIENLLFEQDWPEIDGPIECLPEGGFGWCIVQELADGVIYRRSDGENRLTLRFGLGAPIQ